MNIEDVEKLAELARIELTSQEKESLLRDFDSILAYVDVIKSVKVENVEDDYDLYNCWREDLPSSRNFDLHLILNQFPDSQPARPDDSGHLGGGGIFLKVNKISWLN